MLPDPEVELGCEFTLREVVRRGKLARNAYPFEVTDEGIQMRSVEGALPYVFMLCVSASHLLRKERRYTEVDELFDSMVLDAACSLLGPESSGVRFGWPPSGDRPTGFYDALDWVAERMGLPRGPSTAKPDHKDGGVDVVVWRPFRDGRAGFISMLVQCTVQLDWTPKARDTIPDVWNGWLDLGKPPITCLAIPHAVPPAFEKWDEVRRTVHVLLERFRLASLLAGITPTNGREMQRWVELELTRLENG